jgi:hypothetical protein
MLDIITMLCGNDFDNIEERIERLLQECDEGIELGFDDIIINPPATIVKWDDGTKTVVRCQPNDEYDAEKGIALCFMKKMCGNKSAYNEILKAAIEKYEKQQKKKH